VHQQSKQHYKTGTLFKNKSSTHGKKTCLSFCAKREAGENFIYQRLKIKCNEKI
jgi:hypothetical protein